MTEERDRPDTVEVTPAMAEAGAEILARFDRDADSEYETASAIYRAMARLSRDQSESLA